MLQLHPEEHGISAITGSTWKWLLASRGAGLFYTTRVAPHFYLTDEDVRRAAEAFNVVGRV